MLHIVIGNGSCKVFFIFISATLYAFSKNIFENRLNPCIDTSIVGVSFHFCISKGIGDPEKHLFDLDTYQIDFGRKEVTLLLLSHFNHIIF